jgi:hypothetical protein
MLKLKGAVPLVMFTTKLAVPPAQIDVVPDNTAAVGDGFTVTVAFAPGKPTHVVASDTLVMV